MCYSFKPLINSSSEILILGTIPGQASFNAGEYYANPKNQFWDIIYSMSNDSIDKTYDEKCDFLLINKLALWDVLSHAYREGSLDSNIKNDTPNDIEGLLEKYPNIKTIVFNGTRAEKLFIKYFSKIIEKIKCIRVPSSSPTPGKYVKSIEEKKFEWSKAIKQYKSI